MRNVSTPTVATAEDVRELINNPTAPKQAKLDNQAIARGQRFRRQYIWGHDRSVISHMALWTETAQPLLSPPSDEFANQGTLHTIATNPHLFKIMTPINVDCLEHQLRDHPNPSFVHSVCRGLCEGFWPFAHTHYKEWPDIWDNIDR